MKNTFVIIILAAIVIAGVYFLKNSNQDSGQPVPNRNDTSSFEEVTVTYSDLGYSPKEIRVTAGTTVKFVNQSGNPMWTASDPHPTHTMMFGFDAMRAMMSGESYSFTFANAGTWRYHNHMVPGHMGSVVVE